MRNTNVPAGATAGIQGLNENGYVGGNRIWKKITRSGSVVEHRVHIHAGPNLVAEYNAGVAASTPVQEYVYAGEIDSLVMIRRSDATRYGVTRNRQWSITALHDLANGTIVERYAYEITGKRTIYAANGTTVRTTSSYGNNFGYTNRWHDEDSGLMYFRARYYNPLTGEFLSRDPMEFVDGMSLYRGYFGLNSVDPTGQWVKVAVGVLASITIAVLQTMWSEMTDAGDYFGQDFFEVPVDIAGECAKDKNVPELPPCPEGSRWLTWQGNTIRGVAGHSKYHQLHRRAQGKGKMTWEYGGNTIYNLQAFDNGSENTIGGYWDVGTDETSVVVFATINKRDKEYAPCACDCKTKGVAFVDFGAITFRDNTIYANKAEVCHGQIKIDGQGGVTVIKEIACTKYSI